MQNARNFSVTAPAHKDKVLIIPVLQKYFDKYLIAQNM
jgi:hypothetical protein